MPQNGEAVFVKPAPAHCPAGATRSMVLSAPGRFLPVEGAEVTWSPFLDSRLTTGEITIVSSASPSEAAEAPPTPPSEPALAVPATPQPVKE